MSDCGVSAYGDDVSVADSVASLFEEERKEEEDKKNIYEKTSDDPNEKYQKLTGDLSNKDKIQLQEMFKYSIFQDVSNDKMYILKIKKSKGK